MSTPDPTSAEAVEQLHPATPAGDAPRPARPSLPRRVAARGARAVLGVLRRTAEPQYRRAVDRAVRPLVGEAIDNDPSVLQVRRFSEEGLLDVSRLQEHGQAIENMRVNLELLKGELRHTQEVLDELGMAFAPATGLAGAGARFAELREAVDALERRMRLAGAGAPSAPAAGGPGRGEAPAVPGTAEPDRKALSSTLFDYVGFERRFRGDPEVMLRTLVDRYGELLTDSQPVVDIGCGRGELLGRLAEQGVEVIGVEPDPGMAAEARSRGIVVHEELAGEWLRSVPDSSLGSIITTHVLEHLELDDLLELLELAAAKLRPGGVFVSETPNPASLIVLGNSYLMDPTHVRPLHPSLLSFLCEKAGFRDVRLGFYSPAEDYHLPLADVAGPEGATPAEKQLAETVNAGFTRLNDVLFGPQDYAVIARTPPAPPE